MTVRKGPKGKYFTDVVRKTPVRASIRTSDEIITGTIHVHPEHRTLDALNGHESFLAVTDAEIEMGSDIIEADFVAVNKAHIIWVNPVEIGGENRERWQPSKQQGKHRADYQASKLASSTSREAPGREQ